jgi:hypothetical protein
MHTSIYGCFTSINRCGVAYLKHACIRRKNVSGRFFVLPKTKEISNPSVQIDLQLVSIVVKRCTAFINRCTASIHRCTTSNKEEVVRRPPLAASVRSRGELTNTNTNSDERKHAHAPVYTEIYMRGRWIFHHVISHLLLKQGLADATAAILTGCSSGALGVFTLRTYVSSGCNRRHTH